MTANVQQGGGVQPVTAATPGSKQTSTASSAALGGAAVTPPLFLPSRPVEIALRDGTALPAPLPVKLRDAVLAVRDRVGPRHRAAPEPTLVAPGSIGSL